MIGTPSPAPSRSYPGTLAPDLLRGAEEIAAFLYGSGHERRKVYHLVETARLPHFRLGNLVCARRTTLMAWIEEQESRGGPGSRTEPGRRPPEKARPAAMALARSAGPNREFRC